MDFIWLKNLILVVLQKDKDFLFEENDRIRNFAMPLFKANWKDAPKILMHSFPWGEKMLS